jgi:hypothetical protein
MPYANFSELPKFLQDYIRDFMDDSAESWVKKPLPALNGGTFLDLINNEGIKAASEFALKVGSKLGVPQSIKIPNEYA